jgi:hypothetical protein
MEVMIHVWMMTCPSCRTVIRKARPDEPWLCASCQWPLKCALHYDEGFAKSQAQSSFGFTSGNPFP